MSGKEKKIKVGDVRQYLGVSWRVVERLMKSGAITYERDPLDHRCKLVKTSDLDRLKTASLRKTQKT
jgi:DNA-binding MarR family transcriptional regulator